MVRTELEARATVELCLTDILVLPGAVSNGSRFWACRVNPQRTVSPSNSCNAGTHQLGSPRALDTDGSVLGPGSGRVSRAPSLPSG
jgi:hypothetical protein